MSKSNFSKIIKEICLEENIKLSYLSKDWIIALEKDQKCKIIAGYKFDLNAHGLGEVCDDKYALYELVKHFNLPVVEHHIIYAPNNNEDYAQGCNNINYLKDLFKKYNESVVLKINNGTCGNGVYHITNLEDLEKYYYKLSSSHYSLSLSPFLDITNEYRVIILQNNVELLYKKELPIVYGDGKSTVKELLMNFNYHYFKGYNKPNKDLILNENEHYIDNWKFNLSGGARASLDIKETTKKEVLDIALLVSQKIGLKFGSIDIIKDQNGKYYVLEINSGVMMDNFISEIEDGYNIAKNIYKQAIKLMFNSD